jgi:hypothetical protein
MASVFVDSYTLVDSINAQSPSGPQYNTNIGTATLSPETYIPTGTTDPVILAALRLLNPGAITDDGYSQKALYELLLMIQVNWDNALAALDDNAGVGTTTYEAGSAFGTINENVLSANYDIEPNGMSTAALATFCQALATKIAEVTAKLDADGTITDTDYAANIDIDFTVDTGYIPPLSTTTPFDITLPSSKIKTTGIGQGALVAFLQTAVTNLNALWVQLDADI